MGLHSIQSLQPSPDVLNMSKKRHKTVRKKVVSPHDRDPPESRPAEAVTIAWTVSVTSVFVADLVVIAAHLYSRSNPSVQAARVLEAIMLISAAAMGAISLALLVVAWRSRRLKPPQGYTIFAALVAAAPIIALIGRLL
jgi:hypothetical protein